MLFYSDRNCAALGQDFLATTSDCRRMANRAFELVPACCIVNAYKHFAPTNISADTEGKKAAYLLGL
jgi:hypothetical protein